MPGMTNLLRNALRDHLFRTGSFAKPTNLYAALYTEAPTAAGGGIEVVGASYARVALPVANATFAGIVDGQASNLGLITFPAPTEDWGIVVALGILSAATDGDLYLFDEDLLDKNIRSGNAAPSFPIGNLSITIN